MHGDLSATATFARRAIDVAPADDHLGRGAASALLGLAHWPSGDLEAAHDGYVEGMAELQKAGHISDVLGCAITLADIRIVQGRLGDAMRAFEQSMQLATGHGDTVLRGTADMHVGMSAILRERGDLEAARQHLARNQELGEHLGLPQNPHRWRIATARIKEAEGDLDAARRRCSTMRSACTRVTSRRTSVPSRRCGPGCGSSRAESTTHSPGPVSRACRPRTTLSYLHEFEHITLARALPADEAVSLLERLLLGSGSRRQDGQRHRDPGAVGGRPPEATRSRRSARVPGTRLVAGRAGGLRPGLHRRGSSHGSSPEGGADSGIARTYARRLLAASRRTSRPSSRRTSSTR